MSVVDTTSGVCCDVDLSFATPGRLGAGSDGNDLTPTAASNPGTPRMFLDRFGTDDCRARFVPVEHRPVAEDLDKEYPVYLTTGRLQHYQSGAQTRRVPALAEAQPEPMVEVHPDLAERHELTEDAPGCGCSAGAAPPRGWRGPPSRSAPIRCSCRSIGVGWDRSTGRCSLRSSVSSSAAAPSRFTADPRLTGVSSIYGADPDCFPKLGSRRLIVDHALEIGLAPGWPARAWPLRSGQSHGREVGWETPQHCGSVEPPLAGAEDSG